MVVTAELGGIVACKAGEAMEGGGGLLLGVEVAGVVPMVVSAAPSTPRPEIAAEPTTGTTPATSTISNKPPPPTVASPALQATIPANSAVTTIPETPTTPPILQDL